MTGKTPITGLTKEELESKIVELGEPRYRAGQVMEWVFNKRVNAFSEMTNLPEDFRSKLNEDHIINPLIRLRMTVHPTQRENICTVYKTEDT